MAKINSMTVSGNGNFVMQDNNSSETIKFAQWLIDEQILIEGRFFFYEIFTPMNAKEIYEKFKETN